MGETGKAYVQCKPGTQVAMTDVQAFLSGKVARYKFPTLLEMVDALPVTVWGKVKKIELKQMHMHGSAQSRIGGTMVTGTGA